jgi:hypothetical protein
VKILSDSSFPDPLSQAPETARPGVSGDKPPAAALQSRLDSFAAAALVVDSSGRIQLSNEPAKLLLMPKGRLLGRKLETVLADRCLSQLVADSFQSGNPGSLACTLRLPGDAWREDRQFVVEASPVQPEGGQPFVLVVLKPQLSIGTSAPALPNRTVDVLIQMRGPLTLVQGYLENLLDGMITDPVALRQSLLTMRRSTTQIERILESLRT